jgi:hypothetical protein
MTPKGPDVVSMKKMITDQLIVKSNNLIEASYRLTTQEQRIILFVASMMKPEDEDFQEYYIEIQSFMDLIGVSGHSKYKEIKEITKKLRERTIVIKNLQENSEFQVGWVSSFKYYNREGYVKIRLDPELMPYFLKLKERFTQYHLKNVIKLKSSYSIRVYELLKQYEKVKERYFELPALKKILGIKPGEYKLYGDFNRKVLKNAQKELEEKTDLKFSYKEKKDARKVIGINFFITLNLKNYEPTEPEETDSLNIDLYLKLQNYFCLSPEQAKEAIKLRPEAELQENLAYAEKKYKQGEVESIGSYTWKIIKENIKTQMSMFDIEKQKQKAEALKKDIEKQRRENLEIAYQKFKLEKIEELKNSLPGTKLKEIEAIIKEDIEAKQDKKIGQKMFIRLGIEKELLKLADVPSFEEWQKQMEYN